MATKHSFVQIQKTLETKAGRVSIFSLPQLEKLGWNNIHKLPISIRILLENTLRNCDNDRVTEADIQRLVSWSPKQDAHKEIAFKPGRVILQDFTGVPCVVDLAAMRSAMKHLGGNYKKINPQIPCDLVIDHSIQVDYFGTKRALKHNVDLEYQRNKERYQFLKWGQQAFKNFNVIPPSTGIIHQVNLEYLAKGVLLKKENSEILAYPDTLVGTDSHTTMINGLGILGWGVGGIEAEAVMLGEPIYMLMPDVIGFKLTGELNKSVTATDLVLTITQILRKKGVVGKFIEFFGPGLKSLTLPDRATIANMAPEYGATLGLFPVDNETIHYYRMTGRSNTEIDLIEKYMNAQELFYDEKSHEVNYTETLALDLSTVGVSLAGPKKPHDRIALEAMKKSFEESLRTPVAKGGYGLNEQDLKTSVNIKGFPKEKLTHGAVAIASITSCTNTSNPSVLIGAGLLAKKAVSFGLKVKDYVKTSFTPGSGVVTEYLKDANLMRYLEKLGFHVVGYGCMTCIGNSGPLATNVAKAIENGNIVATSILSGNRNFEGRISPHAKANYLASPLLVVAYALAGTVDIDLLREPLGTGKKGKKVFLKDIWPSQDEIKEIANKAVKAQMFRIRYKEALKGGKNWEEINAPQADLYKWQEKSTYIQEPPFFEGLTPKPAPVGDILNARVLALLGDFVTTDHISPAGAISLESPAGRYLIENRVRYADFNSYGSRRGNDRVMTRGTFANIRLRNLLVPGKEGSWTIYFPDNRQMSIFDAAQLYKKDSTPLIVIAGKMYGTGSSRDWAAKGTALLGVKAVLAESFERIHRSNLVGMGVLPLQFINGKNHTSLNLKGNETYSFIGLDEKLKPLKTIRVIAEPPSGKAIEFNAQLRLDTQVEIDYFKNGGILQTVLRKLAKN